MRPPSIVVRRRDDLPLFAKNQGLDHLEHGDSRNDAAARQDQQVEISSHPLPRHGPVCPIQLNQNCLFCFFGR